VDPSLGLHLLCEVKAEGILGLLVFWKQESRVQVQGSWLDGSFMLHLCSILVILSLCDGLMHVMNN
jgi:hypothetical protein